jgi:hypothetical protein
MALYPEGTSPLPLDDAQRAANKANELSRQALGQNGLLYVNDTATYSGNFVAIQMVTDTVFNGIETTISGPGVADAGLTQALDCCTDTVAATFPAGFILYGPFITFNLVSGSVIAYKA